MLTVTLSLMVAGVTFGSALQKSVYVVCAARGFVVVPDAPDEAPLSVSPLLLVTVQFETFSTFQYNWVVSPRRTKSGLPSK
jgi:hypothetical protein